LPPGVAAYEALKHHVPSAGVCGLAKVNVESLPLEVGVPVEPTLVPPVHDVAGAATWHSVQLTVPVGGPPAELPATVAVSPHVLPTVVALGGSNVVVNPGVAAVTARHSAGSFVPVRLSLDVE
jgi:hypothetical protein